MKKMNKAILLFMLICAFLISAQTAFAASAASAYVDEVLVSTKDCTSPPASVFLNQCSPANSFDAGQQVYFCIKIITDVGGGAVTGKFYIDSSEKKSNAVPAYPAPAKYQIRCDYYKSFSNSDAGNHVFKGEVYQCSGGACSKQVSFVVNETKNKWFIPKIPKVTKSMIPIPYIPGWDE